MFTDARTLPDRHLVETDLAIIGGGVAGITLARAMAGSRTRVCLVEAGGLEYDAAGQALYEGENTGLDYSPVATRLRYFGGSSNHWGGYCRPLDPIDFERRDWIPHSGWPFGFEELAPWYEQASRLVEIEPGRFADAGYWSAATGETVTAPPGGRLCLQFVHFSPPTRFGKRYRDDLEKAPNIQVLLNASVTRIAATPDAGRIRELELNTLAGHGQLLRARTYVLATGGLENARLLLLSRDIVKAGLGNQHDQVGRYFMEHPHLSGFAEIVVADLSRLPRILRERVTVSGRTAQAAYNPAPDYLRTQRLLNATFMMAVAHSYHGPAPGTEDDRARNHRDMLLAARRFLTDDPAPGHAQPGVWLGVGGSCEQSPNPDSRVTLSEQRDALGVERLKLDWRLTGQDRQSFYTHLRSLALAFGASDIGRLREAVADQSLWPQPVSGGSHHMGTTRMSDNPLSGVVDRNCRVHGIDNLYVAGSSVFPTSGSANPTLTLIALALRLADHLKGVIK
ncbi:MAG TPA: GMC family oxidoreductase [Gammaproteobacteria bacterium]|jgi:choline dehydrogenase-like flavoprotein|nr:GMC family oxidoreductase [Gammaproteobacteria bacterium]